MKILVLDNYDSFTYNLLHFVEKVCDHEVEVHRNDKIALDQVQEFDRIMISPGPGLPAQAGILPQLLQRYMSSKAILGVCLGQQAIAEAMGGTLVNLERVYHGVSTEVCVVKAAPLFEGLPEQFLAGRYHSWAVDQAGLPENLEVTATDKQGIIMAMRHRILNVRSVQFHPESILTPGGEQMIRNWIERC
jgi:anthranilate synthase component II